MKVLQLMDYCTGRCVQSLVLKQRLCDIKVIVQNTGRNSFALFGVKDRKGLILLNKVERSSSDR